MLQQQRRFLRVQDALVSSSLKLIDVVEDDIGATESNQQVSGYWWLYS